MDKSTAIWTEEVKLPASDVYEPTVTPPKTKLSNKEE